MTGMARKSRDSLHRGIPRLQWLRFVVALCVICTLITILHSLQLLDLDQKRWSVWPFPYIFRKPQPRPILLLTPRTTTGRALWVREESYVRPVCKKKPCRRNCVDGDDSALYLKLKWDCFSVNNFSAAAEDYVAEGESQVCSDKALLAYNSQRLSALPDLPHGLSLLIVGDSTARQLYEALKAFRACTANFSQYQLGSLKPDRFAAENLGGKGFKEDHLRLSHDPADAFNNRISLAWTNRLLDGESRVDRRFRSPWYWVTRRYWEEVTFSARGSKDRRLGIVFSFGPHFNGLDRESKQEKVSSLLNHTSLLLRKGEVLQKDDVLVFLTVNAGIVLNDTDSQSSRYYNHWKAQDSYFNKEFPRLVLRPSGLRSFVFDSRFMRSIKEGRAAEKNDLMHFKYPGHSPLDELLYAILYATRLF